jgi:3,4-dihydroxy-2-butanone 4-phosphate synthase
MSTRPAASHDILSAANSLRSGRPILLRGATASDAHWIVAADNVTPMTFQQAEERELGVLCLATEERQLQRVELSPQLRRYLKLGASHTGGRYGFSDSRLPVVPVTARRNGLLERLGAAEAAHDIARIASLSAPPIFAGIREPQETCQRRSSIHHHGWNVIDVADILRYRLSSEGLIHDVKSLDLERPLNNYRLHWFLLSGLQPWAVLLSNEPWQAENGPAVVMRCTPVGMGGSTAEAMLAIEADASSLLSRISDLQSPMIVYAPAAMMAFTCSGAGRLPCPHAAPEERTEPVSLRQSLAAGVFAQILKSFAVQQIQPVNLSQDFQKELSEFGVLSGSWHQ